MHGLSIQKDKPRPRVMACFICPSYLAKMFLRSSALGLGHDENQEEFPQ